MYGMNAAAAMLAGGEFKRALVIGSERISPLLDPRERGTSVLFGDGAGAVVLESDPGGTFYMAAGTMPDEHVLYCDRFDPAIMMKGQEVYRFAVSRVPENIENLLDKASLRVSDIDMFVLHQANIRIIESIARQLGIPEGKCFVNIDRQGNTSAASINYSLKFLRQLSKMLSLCPYPLPWHPPGLSFDKPEIPMWPTQIGRASCRERV